MTKYRCSGTMTESQYLAFIRSCLRSKWLRWKPRSDILQMSRRNKQKEGKHKFEYQCSICKDWFLQKEMEVDHYPKSAGSILSVEDIGEFCNNLFCEVENLRVVCKPCHEIHTLSERNGISFEEAKLEKKVIAFGNLPASQQRIILTEVLEESTIINLKNASDRKEAYRKFLKGVGNEKV